MGCPHRYNRILKARKKHAPDAPEAPEPAEEDVPGEEPDEPGPEAPEPAEDSEASEESEDEAREGQRAERRCMRAHDRPKPKKAPRAPPEAPEISEDEAPEDLYDFSQKGPDLAACAERARLTAAQINRLAQLAMLWSRTVAEVARRRAAGCPDERRGAARRLRLVQRASRAASRHGLPPTRAEDASSREPRNGVPARRGRRFAR